MLPISDFHFAFCGIATVAATLGYACARRAVFALASSDESSKADEETGPSEERSLKRKLDADEHDTDAEEQSRPMKRNRTPPIGQQELDEDFNQDWEVIVAPPPYEQIAGLREPEQPVPDKSTPPQEDTHTVKQDVTPVRGSNPPTSPGTSPQPGEKGLEAERYAAPAPPKTNLSSNGPEISPARPVTPPKPTVPAKIEPVNAFSAFSGSNSPFASYSNVSGASPLALSGQAIRTAPAWKRNNESASDVFGLAGSPNALAPSPNNAGTSATTKPPPFSQNKSALGVPSDILVKPSTCLTGEEDETVETELKGAKLFVKRGGKEFTDGIYGHIKILARKSTPQKTSNEDSPGAESKSNSRTRLLFRRDPLGQVSMNVGLHPTVTTKEDVVVYALKPGRAQKADFQSFAKALCDHEGLKSGVVTGPTIPASGVATTS